MSGGSKLGSVSYEPHTTIGAQDLMRVMPNHKAGFLRRRGKCERALETVHAHKLFKWRQRFVVVGMGCLYCFANETSTQPIKAFSLEGYNRLVCLSEWGTDTFKVEPADPTTLKAHYFCCPSDTDRKEWMKAIRQEMVVANNLSADSGIGRGASDEYVYLTAPLFESRSFAPEQNNEVMEDEYDSDYDTIDQLAMQTDQLGKSKRDKLPLPPIPTEAKSQTLPTAKREAPKPPRKASSVSHPPSSVSDDKHDYVNDMPNKKVLPTKPKPTQRKPSIDEYFVDESDRERALQILQKRKAPGTYLVRKSADGEGKVLVVLLTDKPRQYKIFQGTLGVTLDHKKHFSNTDELVDYYSKEQLPNTPQRLGRAYSQVELN